MARSLRDIEEARLTARLQHLGVTPTPRIVAGLMEFVGDTCRARMAGGRDTWAHPAIAAVKAICRANVPAGLIPELIAAIGDQPDQAKLRNCYREWHARGKSPAGWGWALEWYGQGIPARPGATPAGEQRASAAANELRAAGFTGPRG